MTNGFNNDKTRVEVVSMEQYETNLLKINKIDAFGLRAPAAGTVSKQIEVPAGTIAVIPVLRHIWNLTTHAHEYSGLVDVFVEKGDTATTRKITCSNGMGVRVDVYCDVFIIYNPETGAT